MSGLQNATPEDGTPGEHLNWWQASNVKLISDFLNSSKRDSEGMVLCDAPGLGKTLSVVASVVSTDDVHESKNLVIVFAGKGIVAQWGEQIRHHFDRQVLEVFCADSEASKHPGASILSSRTDGTNGGAYVEERANARLPKCATARFEPQTSRLLAVGLTIWPRRGQPGHAPKLQHVGSGKGDAVAV